MFNFDGCHFKELTNKIVCYKKYNQFNKIFRNKIGKPYEAQFMKSSTPYGRRKCYEGMLITREL
jgi:hypothetical protein